MASRAESDHYRYVQEQTRARVARSCATQLDREVHAILAPYGVNEDLSRLLAEDLLQVEERKAYPANTPRTFGMLARLRGEKEAEGDAESSDGVQAKGLTAFLLRCGEGLGRSDSIPHLR